MNDHDYSALFEKYPEVIEQMPETFTSHEFIQRLTYQNQALYIEALYMYRHITHSGSAAPFMIVHHYLTQHLSNCAELDLTRSDAPYTDIFGKPNVCSEWKKKSRPADS